MAGDLGRLMVTRKHGQECFHLGGKPLAVQLLAFWQWSTSDLVSNITRGVLAEFIVATALGIGADAVRDEWTPYDLETEDGIKVEVKSAAFIQSWHQNSLSSISFRTPSTRMWDPDTNSLSSERTRASDVYVFALLAHKEKATIDPMDLDQWRFYVVPTVTIDHRTRSQHSITFNSLEKLSGGAVAFGHLKRAIRGAYEYQKEQLAP